MSRPGQTMERSRIDALAAAWIGRRDAGLSPAEQFEFEQWRQADARHEEALARFEMTWSAVGRPRRTGASADLARELRALQRRKRRRVMSVAGTGLAVVAILGMAWRLRQAPLAAERGGEVATAVVLLPERQTLPDGTLLEHPAGTALTIDYSPTLRRVRLSRGQAYFQVVSEPARPFVVDAAGVEVRAVGTAFSVELGREAIEVLVTHGRVAVMPDVAAVPPTQPAVARPPAPEILVDAGNRVSVPVVPLAASAPPPAVLAVPALETAGLLAWRSPRVEFSGAPLTEVIAVVNRYSRIPLVLADSALGATELSGLFRADDTESFVSMLESGFGVQAERREGRIILRRAR